MTARNKTARIFFAWMTGLLLLAPLLISTHAFAAGDKMITLICRRDETVLNGMEWSLYKIGERNGSTVTFIPELSQYSMDLGDFSEETIETAARTIEGYTLASHIPPIAQGVTDLSGILVFSGLEDGLYLASGKTLQINEYCYYPSALLIEINDDNPALDYDAYPKYYYKVLTNQDIAYEVRKVWVDNDDAYSVRPADITVDLYENGVLEDTAVLNEDNNWYYRWSALDNGSQWFVVERDIPVHYRVMLDNNSEQFLIQNSYSDDETVTTTTTTVTTPTTETTVQDPQTTPNPPETSQNQSNTTQNQSGTTQTSAQTTQPSSQTTVTSTEQLAQTGQLWWPVFPLSLGGVLLIGGGITMRSGNKNDEE